MTISPYVLSSVALLESSLIKKGFDPTKIKLDKDSSQIFIGLTFKGFSEDLRTGIHEVFDEVEKRAKRRYRKAFTFYIRPEEL